MEEVYIVQAYRTAVAKAKKGKLRFVRPDDLGGALIKEITNKIPNLNKEDINESFKSLVKNFNILQEINIENFFKNEILIIAKLTKI